MHCRTVVQNSVYIVMFGIVTLLECESILEITCDSCVGSEGNIVFLLFLP